MTTETEFREQLIGVALYFQDLANTALGCGDNVTALSAIASNSACFNALVDYFGEESRECNALRVAQADGDEG
jgi:hypothetical protein